MVSSRAEKYAQRYAQGVIIRDNDLNTYNTFLRNMGENQTLLHLAGKVLLRKKSCRILDIGCGNANALHEMKTHMGAGVGVHTMGIDLLPLNDSRNADEFIQGDVHAVPLPTNCDIILSFRALHEMGNLGELLPRIAHALAPGGRAYLWVRMREYVNGGPVFAGEMNPLEEKTLTSFSAMPVLDGCKAMVTPVMQHAENGGNSSSFAAGYSVLLYRP